MPFTHRVPESLERNPGFGALHRGELRQIQGSLPTYSFYADKDVLCGGRIPASSYPHTPVQGFGSAFYHPMLKVRTIYVSHFLPHAPILSHHIPLSTTWLSTPACKELYKVKEV